MIFVVDVLFQERETEKPSTPFGARVVVIVGFSRKSKDIEGGKEKLRISHFFFFFLVLFYYSNVGTGFWIVLKATTFTA